MPNVTFSKIIAVDNDTLEATFIKRTRALESTSKNLREFDPQWYQSLQMMNDRLEKLRSSHEKGNGVYFLWHGTSKDDVRQLANDGLARKNGSLGNGVYLTAQSSQACKESAGVLILCAVIARNIHPVLRSELPVSFSANVCAHYAPMIEQNGQLSPIQSSEQTPEADIFVVANENQVLPRFVVYFDVEN